MSLEAVALYFALPAISLSVVVSFIRLVQGPSLPDRVVALDLMTTLGIGVITAYALATDEYIFLDVAIVLALISFLGTIAFAYYTYKRVQ